LIAGPTASGKSGLAISLAEQQNGVVINADSMQVYSGLQILTARPSSTDLERCEHQLFGYVSPHDAYSVARWLKDVEIEINRVLGKGQKAIITGGTGLYFSAMIDGLSPIPEINPEIREKWRSTGQQDGGWLHGKLAAIDPAAAKMLRATDRQRILRALEVFESTGKSILKWQDKKPGNGILKGSSVEKIQIGRASCRERV